MFTLKNILKKLKSNNLSGQIDRAKCFDEDLNRHSKINFVTPVQRHESLDKDILCKRKDVFNLAKKQHPERWSGETRK